MNIAIIGTGYVGLVSGACLSKLGHNILCLDINKKVIQKLKKGRAPFYEPGLSELLASSTQQDKIHFTTSYKLATKSDAIFICVDTPQDKNGNPDLSSLNEVLASILRNAKKDLTIILKSTVPVGTNEYVNNYFKLKSDLSFAVISNPEFLREGSAIKDFMNPDRIILGLEGPRSKRVMQEIYATFIDQKYKIFYMKPESAELTKYAANSFLATKISFINKISHLSDAVGADIEEVKRGIGSDLRIGSSFLDAGLGYGGSCFPKDIKALIEMEKKFNIKHSIVSTVEKVNDNQLEYFIAKIHHFFKGQDTTKCALLIWGLAFKPNTDDVRDSLAIKLIKNIAPQFQHLYAYDALASKNASLALAEIDNITFIKKKYKNIARTHALIICTESQEFTRPNLCEVNKLKHQAIFDGRNILTKQKKKLKTQGISYFGIGQS
ncbi:UDP-glucose/GDP-mannose dehydrogenase family protein [bacterium]|nr:UDP-glucose/GDP-mannose dehydrogenase family protein [bacterium]